MFYQGIGYPIEYHPIGYSMGHNHQMGLDLVIHDGNIMAKGYPTGYTPPIRGHMDTI